ncbi:hypothetical protein GCK32_004776 [Trichostrongylus colubriformis]|uniref:Nematode cuticle collagen N-terminal domain-containing protein n=1 Tax=Trichostrongylus colubriformis TaxID=6319 RepID=A0AAN8FVQ9_TRICO
MCLIGSIIISDEISSMRDDIMDIIGEFKGLSDEAWHSIIYFHGELEMHSAFGTLTGRLKRSLNTCCTFIFILLEE